MTKNICRIYNIQSESQGPSFRERKNNHIACFPRQPSKRRAPSMRRGWTQRLTRPSTPRSLRTGTTYSPQSQSLCFDRDVYLSPQAPYQYRNILSTTCISLIKLLTTVMLTRGGTNTLGIIFFCLTFGTVLGSIGRKAESVITFFKVLPLLFSLSRKILKLRSSTK